MFYDNRLLKARKSDNDPTSRDYRYAYNRNGSLTTLQDDDLGRTTSVTHV